MEFIKAMLKGKKLARSADFFAFLGMFVYVCYALLYAYTTVSDLDEGAYLLKGYLFAIGDYRPFDPGISTNKGPLAFLIPGYVQLLFGPGLRTGRFLAVFFGFMAVLGAWVLSRRLGGKWLAVGAVWAIASNISIIKIYSMGVTQSTIACMLAWSLALCVGEKRPAGHLMLSGLLAGLMMLVRQNMLPVLPLLAVYALWQHGRRAVWLLLPGAMAVALVFFIYWPDILQLWYWVPYVRIPSELSYGGGGTPVWDPEMSLGSRLLSIFQAFRFHFVSLAGCIVSVFLWPKYNGWKSPVDFRAGLVMLVLFLGLTYMHSAAAIGLDYCVFCFKNYMAFFNVAAIFLVIATIRSWNWKISFFAQVLLAALFLVIFAGIGYSAFEEIGSVSMGLPAPRVRDGRILPGLITWRDILIYGFQLDNNSARKFASALFGLCVGVLFTLITTIGWQYARRTYGRISFGAFYASAVLTMGILLSPILSGASGKAECRTDVILANEQIGDHLRSIIPADSLVYWDGGLSTVPLLYLSGVRIFPAQINSGYSFISGGDSQELYKFGYWNEEMDAEWKATADYFIIEERRYPGWTQFFAAAEFDEYAPTPVGTSCIEKTRLRIFKRK